jgi:hypothetical protein
MVDKIGACVFWLMFSVLVAFTGFCCWSLATDLVEIKQMECRNAELRRDIAKNNLEITRLEGEILRLQIEQAKTVPFGVRLKRRVSE